MVSWSTIYRRTCPAISETTRQSVVFGLSFCGGVRVFFPSGFVFQRLGEDIFPAEITIPNLASHRIHWGRTSSTEESYFGELAMFLLKCSKELPLHYAHLGLDILAQFSTWLSNALPYLVDDNLRDLPFLRGATGRSRTKDLGFIATAVDKCDTGLQVFCADTKKWSAFRCVTMYNKGEVLYVLHFHRPTSLLVPHANHSEQPSPETPTVCTVW
jgi:hypothetical protein